MFLNRFTCQTFRDWALYNRPDAVDDYYCGGVRYCPWNMVHDEEYSQALKNGIDFCKTFYIDDEDDEDVACARCWDRFMYL